MQLAVSTTHGPIQGRERNGVALFAGIPYATPPVGGLRWKPPHPCDDWTEVRDATKFGPAAPQLPGVGLTDNRPVNWDEDCLTLNVVTPDVESGARPVMVWIHGGGFRSGSGAIPWYDGTGFATTGDIVVVTINYRLGALGFCSLDGEPTSGINGLLDQIAALEWVRDNIAAFGGDPTKVTVAGESAGAFSVATLTAMSPADGLFRGAIAQSGAAHTMLSAERAGEVAVRFLDALGVESIDDARSRTALEVLEAQQQVEQGLAKGGGLSMPFAPSTGTEALPTRAIDLIADGAGATVPMLTGTNTHEMSLFGMNRMSEDRLVRVMSRHAERAEEMLDIYRSEMPEATAADLAVAFTTDSTFRVPAIRMAEARAASGGTTWMYEFGWESRAFDGQIGATHALEIPFVFDTLDATGADVFLGPGEPPTALAAAMHRTWISFIRDLVPTVDIDGPAGWPAYTADERAVMMFDDEIRLVVDPASGRREAWSDQM